MATEAQINANQKNAEASTGPKSEPGKARSSMNAVKTGLTGRVVLLPAEDAAAYREHLDRHYAEFAPADDREKTLVQFIADTEWRLLRINPLESSIYAIGQTTCLHLVEGETDPVKHAAALQGHIFLTYRKDLHNLALQDRRLRNQLKSDVADLQAMQATRIQKAKERTSAQIHELDRAALLLEDAKKQNITVTDLREFGFVFTSEEMLAYHRKNAVYGKLTRGRNLNFDQFVAAFRAEKKAQAA